MKTKKDYVKKWCETSLTKVKNINHKAPSSYGLKHMCENSIGKYVSNDEMKEVMHELGFKHTNELNEDYNISKIVNRIEFTNKLGKEYTGMHDIYVFNPRSKTITV